VLNRYLPGYSNKNVRSKNIEWYLFKFYSHSQSTSVTFFFFLFDFGLSRLTSLQFIQYHVAGFYKPTIPQSPPSHFAGLQHMQQCQVRVFHKYFFKAFDPNEWCLKNGLHSWGLNPGPLGHESSALTTRPRLLAYFSYIYLKLVVLTRKE
jgi:hypothetical protein